MEKRPWKRTFELGAHCLDQSVCRLTDGTIFRRAEIPESIVENVPEHGVVQLGALFAGKGLQDPVEGENSRGDYPFVFLFGLVLRGGLFVSCEQNGVSGGSQACATNLETVLCIETFHEIH